MAPVELVYHWDWALIALSFLNATQGAWVAAALLGEARYVRQMESDSANEFAALLFFSAVGLGLCGTWAMHYVGMGALTFGLPSDEGLSADFKVHIQYNWPLVVLSVVIVVGVVFLAVFYVANLTIMKKRKPKLLAAGGRPTITLTEADLSPATGFDFEEDDTYDIEEEEKDQVIFEQAEFRVTLRSLRSISMFRGSSTENENNDLKIDLTEGSLSVIDESIEDEQQQKSEKAKSADAIVQSPSGGSLAQMERAAVFMVDKAFDKKEAQRKRSKSTPTLPLTDSTSNEKKKGPPKWKPTATQSLSMGKPMVAVRSQSYQEQVFGISNLLINVDWLKVTMYPITKKGLTAVLKAGILTGTGFCVMHYMCMIAMVLDAKYDGQRKVVTQSWDWSLIAVSVLLGVGAAWIGLFLITFFEGLPAQMFSSVTIGLSMCGMHYTAMYAVTYKVRLTDFVDRDNSEKYVNGSSLLGNHSPRWLLYSLQPFLVSASTSLMRYVITELARFRTLQQKRAMREVVKGLAQLKSAIRKLDRDLNDDASPFIQPDHARRISEGIQLANLATDEILAQTPVMFGQRSEDPSLTTEELSLESFEDMPL